MTRNAAKKFWKEYLQLSCAKGRDSITLNPAHTFLAQARMGAFDTISDEEYASKLKDAEELTLFWDDNITETAKNVFLNAMAKTNITDTDISNIAGILAGASVRSHYSTKNPDKDKYADSIHTIDRRQMDMDITPKQLANRLRKTIIGQDRWLDTLCTSAWMHNLRYRHFLNTGESISQPKTNILCLGQSGTGKTLAIQTLAKLLDLPIVIEDASALRGAGWRGTNVSSIVAHALEAAGNDDAKARHTIVVLDEFDKIFHSEVTDQSFYPVNNLLTFIGGSVVTHSDNKTTCSLDTSSMLFICLGAFAGLEEIVQKRLSGETTIGFGASGYKEAPKENLFKQVTKEDLHEYGISWEFLGRIPLITCTNELTIADYKRILTDSLASPIQQYDNMLFDSIGVHVGISEAAADYIAQQASMTQMGARGLSQTVAELLTPAIYTLANDNSISRITLDFNQNGLYVNQEQGPRPVKKDCRQHGPDISAPIPCADTLCSVPFECLPDQNNITLYSLDMKKASECVKWKPLSKLYPKDDIDAAICILQSCICIQLMADEEDPTMLTLYQIVSNFSISSVSDNEDPRDLNRMCKRFSNMALRNTSDITKTIKIAQYMIKEYAFAYSHSKQL